MTKSISEFLNVTKKPKSPHMKDVLGPDDLELGEPRCT